MDSYKDIALGVEAAWPAFVLALAQAVTPPSAAGQPVQEPAAAPVVAHQQVI